MNIPSFKSLATMVGMGLVTVPGCVTDGTNAASTTISAVQRIQESEVQSGRLTNSPTAVQGLHDPVETSPKTPTSLLNIAADTGSTVIR